MSGDTTMPHSYDILEAADVYARARQLEMSFLHAMLPFGERGRPDRPHKPGRGREPIPLHACFVLLFHSAFPDVPRDTVVELALLDRVYTELLPVYDQVVEQRKECNPAQLFMAQLKQFHSLCRLHAIFPPGHRFWAIFEACTARAWRAVLYERLHRHCRLRPYPIEEFERVARGKVALYKVFVLALACLSHRTRARRPLSRSLDHYHVGIYFLDDLQDWREDYVDCNFTYPLTRVILDNNLKDAVTEGQGPPLWKIGSILYQSGVAEEQIQCAKACFLRAMDCVCDQDLPHWTRLLEDCVKRCASMKAQLRQVCAQGATLTAAPKAAEKTGAPELVFHQNQNHGVRKRLVKALKRVRQAAPARGPLGIYIGTWTSMPPRFHLLREEGTYSAVNLLSAADETVPPEAGVAIACVEAARCGRGMTPPLFAERLFVRGVALQICQKLWPSVPVWSHAGMGSLEWQWCETHLWLLREAAREEAEKTLRREGREWVSFGLPRFPFGECPKTAWSFLGLRAAEEIGRHKFEADLISLLGRLSEEEIRRDLKRYCL